MNYDHEIYKRENLPIEEWSRIEREPAFIFDLPVINNEPEENEDCFNDDES